MAARYWVGGAGTWSSTNTTNWSTLSGGAGGASVPGSADTPTIDGNSGTGTITFTNGGVTTESIVVNNSNGIVLSLGAAIATSGSFTLTAGTVTTNNFNVTVAGTLGSISTGVRTFNLGSSTVTAAVVDIAITTNLTFNVGTSAIFITNGGLYSAGLTFSSVTFTAAMFSAEITGANTFSNLTFAGRTLVGITPITLNASQIVTGSLTFSAGAAARCRLFVQTPNRSTPRTLTCAAFSGTDVDFRDITIAGAAAPVSGTRLGDCKGNSGITFPAAKTVYWNLSGSQLWSADGWALTPGGAVSTANFPLAQDTAVFTSTSPASGALISLGADYNIGTIDMSARTSNLMTFNTSSYIPKIYGNWVNGTGTTMLGTNILMFEARGTQTITSAGVSFVQKFRLNMVGGELRLLDALTNTAADPTVDLVYGTLNLNGYTLTLSNAGSAFTSTNSSSPVTLAVGSGTLVIAGSGGCSVSQVTTVTGTGTISFTSASAKSFSARYNKTYTVTINQGGAGALSILGDGNTFANITNTYSATGATSVLFEAGSSNSFTAFNLTGTAGKVCTLGSTTSSQSSLTKLSTWYMGANSTDAGNNTGLTFSAGGGIDYLSVSYINGVTPNASGGTNFFAFF